MTDQKNTLLAIVLSAIVLIGWQYFVGLPQMQKQKEQAQQQQTTQQQQQQQQTPAPSTAPQAQPGAPATQPAAVPPGPQAPAAAQVITREAALALSPRVTIETPRLKGSIALKGGRIDDLALTQFRETVNPASPAIVLLAPSGTPHPFYAEFGWVRGTGVTAKMPDAETVWRQEGSGALGVDKPVTLLWDNGEGLEFRRIVSVDDKYMLTVDEKVTNKSTAALTLYPYALISRHGTPEMSGYAIRHEGPIGVLGDKCLRQDTFSLSTECHEEAYKTLEDKKMLTFKVSNAWFGFTDPYWAATLIPETKQPIEVHFSGGLLGALKTYQSDYLGEAMTIQPAGTAENKTRLFAGAREVAIVEGYESQLGLNHFDLLIDWGRLYFITKPMFKVIDYFYRLVGNFGLAILIVTVLVKILFFPLANKSYASMAKMKAVQPEMMAIRERFADDKMKQQQALMELYKKEKINPLAGCLPILIQIPVFFALYKVLFVTIEMRHAPFYGWIKDLSAADPTNLFSLFGLLPEPALYLGPYIGSFLHLGIWPIIMGITMFAQMKLNPAPPDPTQKMIFDWMPLIFTFMLAGFSAGLVIYWAWNNTLSVAQQAFIMNKHGAKIELIDNIKAMFKKKKDAGKVDDTSKDKKKA
jgi:YidC/Oxa1 family membrane protein insertase